MTSQVHGMRAMLPHLYIATSITVRTPPAGGTISTVAMASNDYNTSLQSDSEGKTSNVSGDPFPLLVIVLISIAFSILLLLITVIGAKAVIGAIRRRQRDHMAVNGEVQSGEVQNVTVPDTALETRYDRVSVDAETTVRRSPYARRRSLPHHW